MINATMQTTSHQVDAPRQSNNMTETTSLALDADLDFLSLKEVATIFRIAPISVYRLIAKQSLPVYRACRKILFKKKDVLDYLESHRKDPVQYGGPKG